jgi:hypothetical protein
MSENAKSIHPPYIEASLMPPPVSSEIKPGITGIIIPKPITSISKVKNIKIMAGFFETDIWIAGHKDGISTDYFGWFF